MRPLIACLAFVFAAATLSAQAPQPQTPVFRAGIELLTVDVTALDNNGRQVMDLVAGEFQVEVDGNRRQVATVEYVRSVDPLRVIGEPHKVTAPDETFSTSNAKGAPRGRLIVLLVDQGNIRTGTARSTMNSAKKFVDTLTPEDRVAVIAVPGPGENLDFTTNHDRVREALLRIVGQASPLRTRFNISVTEAMALYMNSNQTLAFEVINRECGALRAQSEIERCEREVDQDAAEVVNEVRQRTQDSVNGMRAVLQSLAGLDGPKSVIIVSEGLVFESIGSETDELAGVAADSRASIDILMLDVPPFDASQSAMPTTPREDRDLQIMGLEQLAGASRGTLHRVNASAQFAFDRISRALDGYYLLGVESRPEDRNGRRHRIAVKATRPRITIRSRRSFLTSISAKATTPADAVNRAIRSPLPINDLPLKIATWTYKQPGSGKVRVMVAAEVERLSGQSLDYTAGMALVNKQGRGVAPPVALQRLMEKEGDPAVAVFSGVVVVDPGEYRLIFSMADSEGRVGSVSRTVTAWQMDQPGLSIGDLLLGSYAAGQNAALAPAIEPAVTTGRLAAVMEAYGPPSLLQSFGGTGQSTAALEGTLEILTSEDSAPLATVPMRIGAGPSPEIATASAQINTTSLPPGRYLARGTLKRDGKPQGHVLRPFRIAAGAAAASETSAPVMPTMTGALPGEMAMVLLGGLSNFDRKALLTPAILTSVFAAAESRPTGSKAAVKEARGGDLGAAAMTALGEGDQVLATFLKGLELYQGAQLDRAAMQFQNSMQMAPAFAPSRLFLGAVLAEGNRHKEAAGLLQSAATMSPGAATTAPDAAIARLAGETWIKAGNPQLAITPLELAVAQPKADPRAQKLLGIAYVLAGRAPEAIAVLTPFLAANPADPAALLAAIFATYTRHLNAPQAATLIVDRANIVKWAKAYTGTKGPMQPLVTAWVAYVQGIK